jgi:hypothetical protein
MRKQSFERLLTGTMLAAIAAAGLHAARRAA